MADPALLAEAYRRGLLPPEKKAAYEEAMRRGIVAGKPKSYTIATEVRGARDRLTSDFKAAYGNLGAAANTRNANGGERAAAADRLGSDAINLLASPVVGALRQFGSKPISRATGIPEDYIEVAAMGAGMAAGNMLGRAPTPRTPRATPDPAVNVLASRAKANPVEMRAKATEMRAAGVQPTVTDVVGDRGRRVIRAAGTKTPAAGERLATNARTATATAKPAIMARTRSLTGEKRTADELVAHLFKVRDEAATTNYAPAYATPVRLDETVLRALSDEPGKAALRRARSAAVARMDDGRVKEIDSILNVDPAPGRFSSGPIEDGYEVHRFEFIAPNGERVTGVVTPPKGRGPIEVDINGAGSEAGGVEGAGRIGPAAVRGLLRHLKAAYPDATGVTGLRTTGARPRPAGAAVSTANVRPAQPQAVSAATLHRARIAMREREKTAKQRNAGDMASGLAMRGKMLDDALDRVPEMAPANADYRAKTQAIKVLEGKKGARKDVFSTDPTDYAAWVESLSPEALQANKIAIRQEVLDTLGGQRSSTVGSVDEITTSQYARANLDKALGAEAGPYLDNLAARLEQLRNARFVDPNAGSRTAVLESDLEGVTRKVGAVADTAQKAARGDVIGVAMNWLRSRGISDRDAMALADAATDPAKLDAVIAALERRVGPVEAQRFRALARPAAATQGALLAQTGQAREAR